MSSKTLLPRIAVSSLAFATALAAQPLLAQDTADTTPTTKQPDDDLHNRANDQPPEIVVTAAGLTQLDVLAGTSVVEGVELQRSLENNIGETLAKVPGVTASGFAPGVSRPVLRGFSGERVRVLVDGLGSIDVSNTSADHAVTIDPLTAERIDVLRGPAVLLYGSQAIGGAVNVIDKRIPLRMPDEPVHFDGLVRADTALDTRQGGLSVDFPVGQHFAFNAGGSYVTTNDLKIPGYAVAPAFRAQLLADADAIELGGDPAQADDLRAAANQYGFVPGTGTETWTASVGGTFFADDSSLGVSVGWYNSDYGIPARPGDGESGVSIGLKQFRADMRGELSLGDGFFDQLTTRVGFSDYTHTEFEGDEVGTVFDVQGLEARAELSQNRNGGWGGSTGLQYYSRDFDAVGAEAYIPKNLTRQFSLFTLQELDTGPVHLEAAGRFESTDVRAPTLGISRSFSAFSGALGIAHETDGGLRFGINGSRAERAPSAEEMFSNGAHIATQAFEVGDVNLVKESAWGLEAYVRGRLGPATISFAAYQNWFSNFVYQNATGQFEDGLPVFEYLQGDVNYRGLEGELKLPVIDTGAMKLVADLRGDLVDAKLKDGTPLPRIPPVSLLGALEADFDTVNLRGEVQWFGKQTAVAPYETPTDGFTMVNASVSWRPISGNNNVTLILKADNIFNVEGRRHTSFTKDFVPLAGRNFQASLRFSF